MKLCKVYTWSNIRSIHAEFWRFNMCWHAPLLTSTRIGASWIHAWCLFRSQFLWESIHLLEIQCIFMQLQVSFFEYALACLLLTSMRIGAWWIYTRDLFEGRVGWYSQHWFWTAIPPAQNWFVSIRFLKKSIDSWPSYLRLRIGLLPNGFWK